jgi:hypothetical protein
VDDPDGPDGPFRYWLPIGTAYTGDLLVVDPAAATSGMVFESYAATAPAGTGRGRMWRLCSRK